MLRGFKRIFAMDTQIIEVLHASLLLIWSIMLLFLFDAFQSSPSFKALDYVADEGVWGLIGLVNLCVILSGVYFNHTGLRRLGSMTGVLWWGTVATGLILANPTSTSGWVYLVFTHFIGWAYIRARRVPYVREHPDA